MGSEQSALGLDRLPGFNPDVAASKKQNQPIGRKNNTAPKYILEHQTVKDWNTNPDDAFFSNVTIKDHITPIYDDVDRRRNKEELDQEIRGTADLSKLLDELDVRGKALRDSDGDLGDDGNGCHEDDHDDSLSSSTDAEDRGVYHHELDDETGEEVDIYSGAAHPLKVSGDCSAGQTLRCKDLSDWRSQFPVYRIQWFIGAEIGSQLSFKVTPECEGKSFILPASAVGFYVKVVASRRVENQVHDTYHESTEVGAYDAHVQRAPHADVGIERPFTDIHSTAVVGPVFISDEYSYLILKALRDASFECSVKLRDEVPESGQQEAVRGKLLSKVPATMTVSYSAVEFRYVIEASKKRKIGSSSLFSLAWLLKLFGKKEPVESLKGKAKSLSGQVAAKLRLKTVSFRLCSGKKTIVLATQPRKNGYNHTKVAQDLIRFDPDPRVGRERLLFICFAFQAAAKFKKNDPAIWEQACANGEVDQGKDLIQRYIEYLSTDVEAERLAFEEIPLNPWEY